MNNQHYDFCSDCFLYKDISRIFQGYFKKKNQRYFKYNSRIFQEQFNDISRTFQTFFQE